MGVFCANVRCCISITIASFSPVIFLTMMSASCLFQNWSFSCHALSVCFCMMPWSSICQYFSGLNACISCSLSVMIFSVGPCTLPVLSILNWPDFFMALVSAREMLMP